jgi:hypothetical protein
MDIYIAMLGGVFISSLFVFCIWLNVFFKTFKEPSGNISHSKLIITSFGLVINSISILMVMVSRIYSLFNPIDLTLAINLCYGGMVLSDALFLLSASIGKHFNYIKVFAITLTAWFVMCLFVYKEGLMI